MCAAAWTLAGVIGSQLSDEESIINVEGQDVTVAQYIDSTYGFSKDRVWYSALILVGFCIAFWFVVAGERQPSLLISQRLFGLACWRGRLSEKRHPVTVSPAVVFP